MTKVSDKSTSNNTKSDNNWLDCEANEHFVWNRNVCTTYEKVKLDSVETFNGIAYIVDEWEVSFKFKRSEIMIKCKHAHEFKENLLSL